MSWEQEIEKTFRSPAEKSEEKELLEKNMFRWNGDVNTLRTGLLNCLNARSRGLNFRHRASCI